MTFAFLSRNFFYMENDKTIEAALAHEKSLPSPTVISFKQNGKPFKVVKITEPPTVSNEIVRIMTLTDPMAFLAKVINGDPLPVYVVDEDGTVSTYYENATLAQRTSAAKFLTDKIIPKRTVNAHLVKHEESTDGPGDRSMKQLESEAADKSE